MPLFGLDLSHADAENGMIKSDKEYATAARPCLRR
jgi:hypothetical protein